MKVGHAPWECEVISDAPIISSTSSYGTAVFPRVNNLVVHRVERTNQSLEVGDSGK